MSRRTPNLYDPVTIASTEFLDRSNAAAQTYKIVMLRVVLTVSLAISKTTFPKVVQQNRGLRPVAPFLHQTSQKRNPSQEREGFLPAGLCFATFSPLLPLGGVDSDVPSFQLRPVFAAVSNRVPPGNAMSCFVDLGGKSRDNFENSP